ncbi:uncharacterized protein EDB91DRAFT_1254440 [Suillus paluster]|uniref:uncharacterized protein n=1 Tax=Suillus paluster TaxID=48578 RepID=UPI001B879502|nr:uncharacterized protein EDB91DRAFT_1254440 [Suillus paluster]KAG1726182.1 hypothetical protein EDB91DRAFT_1254440 [Suillus paluster]
MREDIELAKEICQERENNVQIWSDSQPLPFLTYFGPLIQATAYHHSWDNDVFDINGPIDYPNDHNIGQMNGSPPPKSGAASPQPQFEEDDIWVLLQGLYVSTSAPLTLFLLSFIITIRHQSNFHQTVLLAYLWWLIAISLLIWFICYL